LTPRASVKPKSKENEKNLVQQKKKNFQGPTWKNLQLKDKKNKLEGVRRNPSSVVVFFLSHNKIKKLIQSYNIGCEIYKLIKYQ
jgi:uncharacterized protein (UPF0262 family)